MHAKFDDAKAEQKLKELRLKEADDLAQILSERYGIPYLDMSNTTIDTDSLRILPEDEAKKGNLAIFGSLQKKLSIAISSPNNEKTAIILHNLKERGYTMVLYVTSTQGLERAWSRYKDISFATESKSGILAVSSTEIEKFINEVQSIKDAKKIVQGVMGMKKSFRISRIVEIVVAAGMGAKASDIHVEPEGDNVNLRFRLDGVLTIITTFDTDTYNLLLSRIKLLSGLKLNIKEQAQNGRFSVKIGDTEIEIRTSTLPGKAGESIVMRLLDPNSLTIPLPDLGISPKLLSVLMEETDKPNGLILNTGPTGSGKTTALYAFLNRKRNPGIKIITIEDPIEYHLPGVVQTQVNRKKGYDFADGLKSSLRQDPDVIMVGEIRDHDTAETAIHAALTGHLVFSTLHTNTAAGAFPRLIGLGVNSKILTSAVNVIIAQRLVRKVCEHCKQEIILEGEELEIVKSIYDSIDDPVIPPFPEKFIKAVGCEKCNGIGYRGRIGIFEAILTDKAVEEVLQINPTEREIVKAAEPQGIMDMVQDGIIKAIKGITTIEEIERVVELKMREKEEEPIKPVI